MGKREFYQLRRYLLSSGPQRKLADDYFRDALVPALNRLEISPVGVFSVSIGPETPVMYVLIPSLRPWKLWSEWMTCLLKGRRRPTFRK